MPMYPHNETLVTLLQDMLRRLENLERANPLVNASIPDGGIQIEGGGSVYSENFDGDVVTGALGTQGVALGGPLGALFVNDIFLRGGIIGNDALTSPVTFGLYNGSNGTTTVGTTTGTVTHSGSIAVPDGFSQALVMCIAETNGYNTTAGYDFLYCNSKIAGVSGRQFAQGATPGATVIATAQSARVLTGLSGGSIAVECCCWAQESAWPGNNSSSVSAIALFLR